MRGRIAVAVDPAAKSVITIMWYKQFQSGDTKRRNVADEEEYFRDAITE